MFKNYIIYYISTRSIIFVTCNYVYKLNEFILITTKNKILEEVNIKYLVIPNQPSD